MANRKQRRDVNRIMKRPELKTYVDKICMDMANILIDQCEEASKEATAAGTELKIESIEDKVKDVMMNKGEELARKVQQIAQSYKAPQDKPNFKINIR